MHMGGVIVNDNKSMIYFYSVLFVVFTLLAYVVDLNGQYHFVKLNSPFISNSFCFAILSGILTGVIVALAAELRQYLLHKRQMKNNLYAIASELYALISVQKASLMYYVNNPSITIPENIGEDYAQQPILVRISQFRAIDYSTFSKKDNIQLALKSFAQQIDLIERTVRNLIKLQIVHKKIQISLLEKYDDKRKVTSSSPVMLAALHEENNAFKECLITIDAFCSVFEKIDGSRFSWKRDKNVIDEMGKKIESDIYFEPKKNK